MSSDARDGGDGCEVKIGNHFGLVVFSVVELTIPFSCGSLSVGERRDSAGRTQGGTVEDAVFSVPFISNPVGICRRQICDGAATC